MAAMKESLRWLAAFLLMLLLPVQGLAGACAQMCLKAQAITQGLVAPDAASHDSHHHCDESGDAGSGSGTGEGKCCHAHSFMMKPPSIPTAVSLPAFEPLRFVAGWTSFIPEEPSPPPIGFRRFA
jgi:hypothetical protein